MCHHNQHEVLFMVGEIAARDELEWLEDYARGINTSLWPLLDLPLTLNLTISKRLVLVFPDVFHGGLQSINDSLKDE